MSSKELRRAGVLARVESGELKLVSAAVMMGMSYRQSKRLVKRYREGGLSHSLGDCGTLTTNRTFHLLRKGDTSGDTSNVVSMGTFLMSVDNSVWCP